MSAPHRLIIQHEGGRLDLTNLLLFRNQESSRKQTVRPLNQPSQTFVTGSDWNVVFDLPGGDTRSDFVRMLSDLAGGEMRTVIVERVWDYDSSVAGAEKVWCYHQACFHPPLGLDHHGRKAAFTFFSGGRSTDGAA